MPIDKNSSSIGAYQNIRTRDDLITALLRLLERTATNKIVSEDNRKVLHHQGGQLAELTRKIDALTKEVESHAAMLMRDRLERLDKTKT